MSLPASPEIESAITQIAARNGLDVAQLVNSVLGRFIHDEARDLEAIRAAVDEGLADLEAGRFTDYATGAQLAEEIKREARDRVTHPD